MRVVFMGTPEFAVPHLERIVADGHDVLAVLTQPDRPKGRGQQVSSSPVKEAATRLNLRVEQPERVRRPEIVAMLRELRAEVMVVVGYGQIIPQSIIDLPPHGIINIHASLLPKYRGAAPVQWAIANGETTTGVTAMRIDAGLDTGDMLLKAETAIGPAETAPELGRRLAAMGSELLSMTLVRLRDHSLQPEPQNDAEATYAPVLKKEDGRADWRLPAVSLWNRSRGFLPWPGLFSTFRGQILHIWGAKPANDISLGVPGSVHVIGRRLLIACGQESTLEIEELQLEGRKRMSAEAFRNGQRLSRDEMLGEQES
jgi:methionyl-tRNA formyltransferase